MVGHRGVGGGEVPAPVFAWFEEATGAPAGHLALTDAQHFAGVAGRRPELAVLVLRRFWCRFT